MIDIKSAIYARLTSSVELVAVVWNNIHIFADDSDEIANFDDRLPQVTYARIVGKPSRIGVKNDLYQISSWGKTPMEAEEISFILIDLFNRTMSTNWRFCNLELVNDSFDAQTKAYGIHLTLKFTVLDKNY